MDYVESTTVELREKYLNSEVEPYIVVVALVAMAKAGKIRNDSITAILNEVFKGFETDLIKGLTKAREIIDAELIDEVIEKA